MLDRLKRTGKLGAVEAEGDGPQSQQRLFTEN
jgi:hypothetical protein